MTVTAPAVPAKPRRFPWLVYLIILAVIVIVTGAPMVAASMVDVIAAQNHCSLIDGGTTGECVDASGNDLRPLISQLMLWGWMMILILPVGFIAFLVWAIVLVLHLITFGGAARNQAKLS